MAEQVALLGAGVEPSAYRLNLPTHTLVFEVDHAGIFTAKKAVLEGVNRCRRREVHADLARDWEPPSWTCFEVARRTVWLAEGLFFYLTEDGRQAVAAHSCSALPGARRVQCRHIRYRPACPAEHATLH